MRDDTLNKVAVALARKDATVRDLQQITGLSYQSVRAALDSLKAEAISGTWPPRWHMDGQLIDKAMSMATKHQLIGGDGTTVEVGIRNLTNVPEQWTGAKLRLANALLDIDIKPDSDVAELAEKFAQAARTLSSFAYRLQLHRNDPDWFEKTGGALEQDLVQ